LNSTILFTHFWLLILVFLRSLHLWAPPYFALLPVKLEGLCFFLFGLRFLSFLPLLLCVFLRAVPRPLTAAPSAPWCAWCAVLFQINWVTKVEGFLIPRLPLFHFLFCFCFCLLRLNSGLGILVEHKQTNLVFDFSKLYVKCFVFPSSPSHRFPGQHR